MKFVRNLTLVFASVMIVVVAAFWQMAIITGDMVLVLGAAALVLLAVSFRRPRSLGRWRSLFAGWAIFTGMIEAASIMGFVSRADPAIPWGLAVLTLSGVIVAIWTFLQQRRSRARYFEGYFEN